MSSSQRILCPVCSRESLTPGKCTFCGTNLGESEPSTGQPAAPASPGETTLQQPDRSADRGTFQYPADPQQSWQQGQVMAPRFAGFWIRVLAYLCDGLIIQIIISLLFAVGMFGYTAGSEQGFSGDVLYRMAELNLRSLVWVSAGITLAYFTLFLGSRGQTPGKMLFGLKVLRTDGSPVTYTQAFIRTVGYYLNHILTLEIGFLWVAIDRRKQGLHDKIAGTVEIRPGLAEIRGFEPPLGSPNI